MAKVNIAVRVADRDLLKELAWRERRPGFNPSDMAEQLSKVLAFYIFANEATPKNDE